MHLYVKSFIQNCYIWCTAGKGDVRTENREKTVTLDNQECIIRNIGAYLNGIWGWTMWKSRKKMLSSRENTSVAIPLIAGKRGEVK